jgi:ubiquinone/menaquinone biosynthesis C-methylase UbiE
MSSVTEASVPRRGVNVGRIVMKLSEFDQFADEYYAQHKTNIAITGENPEYFAEYKIAELRRLANNPTIEPAKIIDFGSGIGNSIPSFRKYFAGAEVTCADVSPRSLELSRSRFPGSERFLLIEASTIPAPDRSYDVAFSACVFHHIAHEEHVGWLKELRRVTRNGGLLAIFEHNPLNPLTVRAVNTCPFDVNARLIRARELSFRLREAGWRDVSIHYHLFFPRLLAPLRILEPWLRGFPLGAQYSVVAHNI